MDYESPMVPQLPAISQLRLAWVYITYTYSRLIPRDLGRISRERGLDTSEFLKEEHLVSNHKCGRHAGSHPEHVKSLSAGPNEGIAGIPQGGSKTFAIHVGAQPPVFKER